MAILLVRHGETTLNAARVVQFPHTPLSARGRRQAALLAGRLAPLPVAVVMVSDHARALDTARAIVERTGARLVVDPGLGERDLGEYRGKHHAELGLDPRDPDHAPPGGETPTQFRARVAEAWARVVAAQGDPATHVVVVTHGLVCRELAARHLTVGDAPAPAWDNTCLTVVEGGPPWRTTLLACTAHLAGMDTAGGVA